MNLHQRRYFKLLENVLKLPHELLLMMIPKGPIINSSNNIVDDNLLWLPDFIIRNTFMWKTEHPWGSTELLYYGDDVKHISSSDYFQKDVTMSLGDRKRVCQQSYNEPW